MPPGKQSSEITYIVYGVEQPAPGQKPGVEQSLHATADMDAALKQAQTFFESEKYLLVDVKKKYHEEKTGRVIEMSLKQFVSKPRKDFGVALFLILAVAAGGAAFGLTFLAARMMGGG
jgi:hypothetical protein